MRSTLDLPQDLHRALTSLALNTGKSLSQTAVELMQRGLASLPDTAGQRLAVTLIRATGLPLVRFARTITPEDVKALDDGG